MTPNALESFTKSARHAIPAARNAPKKRAPFSLRFSDAERADLDARAGATPLGAYIKSQLFDGARKPARKGGASIKNSVALAKALALLGQTRIASNLNQLAKAANIGTLPLTPEVEDDLKEAFVYISEIRCLLIDALGLQSGGR